MDIEKWSFQSGTLHNAANDCRLDNAGGSNLSSIFAVI